MPFSRDTRTTIYTLLTLTGVLLACQTSQQATDDSGSSYLETTEVYRIGYRTALTEVRRPEKTKNRYGDYEIVKRDTTKGKKYIYEDDLISAAFVTGSQSIFLIVGNRTDHTIRVRLGQGAYVGRDGSSERLLTGEMSYRQRNESAPPMIIPAGARSSTSLIPSGNLLGGENAGDVHVLMGPQMTFRDTSVAVQRDTAYTSSIAEARENIGDAFSVLLPIEVEGTVNEYTFKFEVESAYVENDQGKAEL